MKQKTIGDRIKYIRGQRTKVEFAEELGTGRKPIQLWESSAAMPLTESLLKLHTKFDVNINWLFSGQSTPYVGGNKRLINLEKQLTKMEARITALE